MKEAINKLEFGIEAVRFSDKCEAFLDNERCKRYTIEHSKNG